MEMCDEDGIHLCVWDEVFIAWKRMGWRYHQLQGAIHFVTIVLVQQPLRCRIP